MTMPMQQKPTERKAALAGKREAFDELIARLESRLKDTNLEELRKKATTLDEQISGKLEQLETSAESIQELQTTRQSAFNLVETSNARLETIVELLARFAILKDHYLSDLKRLDFLQETDHYFDQLTAVKCPLCGTLLEAYAAQKMCVDATTNGPDMQQACAAEAAKIRNLLKDLEQTIGGLESERKEVTAKSQEQRAELGRLEQSLSQELRPVFVATKRIWKIFPPKDRKSTRSRALFKLWNSIAARDRNWMLQRRKQHNNLKGLALLRRGSSPMRSKASFKSGASSATKALLS